MKSKGSYRRDDLILNMPIKAMCHDHMQVVLPVCEKYYFESITVTKPCEVTCRLDPDQISDNDFSAQSRNRLISLVGKAKCHPLDKFDAETGFKIAQSRLLSMINRFFNDMARDCHNRVAKSRRALEVAWYKASAFRNTIISNVAKRNEKVKAKPKAKAKPKVAGKASAKIKAKNK